MEKNFKYIFSLFLSLPLIFLFSCSSTDCPPNVQPPEIVYELNKEIDYSAIDTTMIVDTMICDSEDVKQPSFDYVKMQNNVIYPQYAKCNGIGGRVVVKSLIDKYGNYKKGIIEESSSKYLNKSALQAVAFTKFKPAKQCKDGKLKNVMVWVSIPIRYRLR